MSALKRLSSEINKTHKSFDDKNIPYEIIWINTHTDYADNSNIIAKIDIDFYSKYLLTMDIPNIYPFKPPFTYIKNNKKYIRYNTWLVNIYVIISNRKYLSLYDLQLAWLFSLNKYDKFHTIQNIPHSLLNECLCCKSITCYNKWNPINKIEDIIYEYIFYKKILFYTSNLGLKYISSIFDNDKWSIPIELVINIIQFI